MKKTLLRNNIRKLQNNPHQSTKTIHSQSPTHKKLLKKIELTQREPANQYDMSLQDNLVFQKPQEEVVDFRVEIERRFQKSFANHTFVFPRRKLNNEEMLEESGSSHNSSFDSIRHVTVYELVSQNKKRQKVSKHIYRTHDEYGANGRPSNSFMGKENYRIYTEPDQGADSDEYDVINESDLPIEVKIRDKSSSTYKKLIDLLERQLKQGSNNENKPVYIPQAQVEDNQPREEQRSVYKQVPAKQIRPESKEKRTSTNPYARKMMTKDESQRSLGYHVNKARLAEVDRNIVERNEGGQSFHDGVEKFKKSTKNLNISQRLKKVQSRDKISSLLDASGREGGESLLSLDSRVSPNGKRFMNDISKLSQESKKKIYNGASSTSSLLRALTPKYMASKNIYSIREKSAEKSSSKPSSKQSNQVDSLLATSQTTASTLYQKAQDDVLNGKLRMSAQKSQKKLVSNPAEVVRTEKDENIRSLDMKAMNFIDFYGSPKMQQVKNSQALSHTMYNNYAKSRNTRKLDTSGEKSSERHLGYMSYELSNRNNTSASKPTFKLDLSSRIQKQRDALSSNRTRDNQSKEKSTDVLSIDSILKGSYDMHNHSLVRNASKQSDLTKRKLGVTPKGNISKANLLL